MPKMHELSIAKSLLKIVLGHAAQQSSKDAPGGRVVEVRLRVGVLTQVIPDSLRFCFDLAARGTKAEGARLEINICPLKLRCRACGQLTESEQPAFACSACGGTQVELMSGRELMVESLVLET